MISRVQQASPYEAFQVQHRNLYHDELITIYTWIECTGSQLMTGTVAQSLDLGRQLADLELMHAASAPWSPTEVQKLGSTLVPNPAGGLPHRHVKLESA